jgi:hypothetical protein
MEGRITRFRFSWMRDRTGSALQHREEKLKALPETHFTGDRPENTRDKRNDLTERPGFGQLGENGN